MTPIMPNILPNSPSNTGLSSLENNREVEEAVVSMKIIIIRTDMNPVPEVLM